MSKEVMKLALSTLEGWANYDDWVWPESALEQAKRNTIEAITALRERLAQPEQEPVAWMCSDFNIMHRGYSRFSPTRQGEWNIPLYTAPPKQEPVAWMHNFIEGGISIGKKPTDLNRHPDRWTALYKDPTPCKTCQALAMAVMNDQTYHEKIIPKREWVGLTLNEAEDFYDKYTDRAELINAVDRFLEEKNHG